MQRPGFTLMELIVYLGISTLVILVISKFMVDVSTNAARNRASLEIQSNTQFVMNRLAQNIRTAETSPAMTISPDTLTLTSQGKQYVYTLTSDAVTEAVDGGSPVALTTSTVKVETLTFASQGGGVQISLRIVSAEGGQLSVPPQELSSIVIPRQALY